MKKKTKIILIVLILILILSAIMILILNKNSRPNANMRNMDQSIENTRTVNPTVQTIQNTISSTGQIDSEQDEKVSLNTSYYFQELLVDENVYIAEGTNILEYTNGTYLQAPYNCVLISSSLPEKEEICTSSNYVELKSLDSLAMSLQIDESEINKVSIGDEAEIEITSTNEILTGYVTQISEVGTYSTSGSTFSAVVSFANNGNLKIGMSASCTIILEEAENALTIPLEALQTDDEQNNYVTVINDDGTSTKQEVEIGIQNDAYVQIISGLSEENKIEVQETSTDANNSFSNFMPGEGMGRQNMGDENPPERTGETPGFNDK